MKTNILILSLICASTILFSCKSSKDVQPKGTPINFTEIKSGKNSGYTEYTTVTIRNTKEFSDIWAKLFANYDKKPPIPEVNFENKMLIVSALGERNNGGYLIKTKSILETKNSITVIIEETKPGNTCNSASVMVYPFQLVEMPKTDKEFTFTKTLKVKDCNKGF